MMAKKSLRSAREMRGRRRQDSKRKQLEAFSDNHNNGSDDDENFLLKILMKYSRYSWGTWIVLKIFIKITTYSMLLAKDMEEEAYKWISDWGPLVNPFIDLIFLPGYRVIVFLYQQFEPFVNDIVFHKLIPLYESYLKVNLEPVVTLIHKLFVDIFWIRKSIYEALLHMDVGTVSFILLFFLACGEVACYYWKMEMKKTFRKVKKQMELEGFNDAHLRYILSTILVIH